MKQELSYDQRYRKTAQRFALVGGIIILAGVLLNQFLVVIAGVLVFGYGYGSLQPVNQVKAFARQCAIEPGHEMAQGLLNSLECTKQLRMTKASIQLVQNAVEAYAQIPDTDLQRVQMLRDAVQTRVVKKLF